MSEKATPGWPEPDEERAGQLHQFLNNLNLNADRLLLFDQALTHSSYAFEHSLPGDNERLEFLGDTVIGLVVSEWLYSSLPESGEGDLSKKKALFVSRTVLGKRAEALGLGKVLRLGKGDSRSGTRRRSSVLGSALEAFVGAAYLELDYRVVRQFVLDQIAAPSRVYLQQPDLRDYKSMLQEAVQKHFHQTPQYKIINEAGPDHEKQFRVEVSINGVFYGIGEGKRRKTAENSAAQVALENLTKEVGSAAETGGGDS